MAIRAYAFWKFWEHYTSNGANSWYIDRILSILGPNAKRKSKKLFFNIYFYFLVLKKRKKRDFAKLVFLKSPQI